MKARAHCLCGAGFEISTNLPEMARKLNAIFWEGHSGPGHGAATAREAANARRRKAAQDDRQIAREARGMEN
jgi:hypothetical protein